MAAQPNLMMLTPAPSKAMRSPSVVSPDRRQMEQRFPAGNPPQWAATTPMQTPTVTPSAQQRANSLSEAPKPAAPAASFRHQSPPPQHQLAHQAHQALHGNQIVEPVSGRSQIQRIGAVSPLPQRTGQAQSATSLQLPNGSSMQQAMAAAPASIAGAVPGFFNGKALQPTVNNLPSDEAMTARVRSQHEAWQTQGPASYVPPQAGPSSHRGAPPGSAQRKPSLGCMPSTSPGPAGRERRDSARNKGPGIPVQVESTSQVPTVVRGSSEASLPSTAEKQALKSEESLDVAALENRVENRLNSRLEEKVEEKLLILMKQEKLKIHDNVKSTQEQQQRISELEEQLENYKRNMDAKNAEIAGLKEKKHETNRRVDELQTFLRDSESEKADLEMKNQKLEDQVRSQAEAWQTQARSQHAAVDLQELEACQEKLRCKDVEITQLKRKLKHKTDDMQKMQVQNESLKSKVDQQRQEQQRTDHKLEALVQENAGLTGKNRTLTAKNEDLLHCRDATERKCQELQRRADKRQQEEQHEESEREDLRQKWNMMLAKEQELHALGLQVKNEKEALHRERQEQAAREEQRERGFKERERGFKVREEDLRKQKRVYEDWSQHRQKVDEELEQGREDLMREQKKAKEEYEERVNLGRENRMMKDKFQDTEKENIALRERLQEMRQETFKLEEQIQHEQSVNRIMTPAEFIRMAKQSEDELLSGRYLDSENEVMHLREDLRWCVWERDILRKVMPLLPPELKQAVDQERAQSVRPDHPDWQFSKDEQPWLNKSYESPLKGGHLGGC